MSLSPWRTGSPGRNAEKIEKLLDDRKHLGIDPPPPVPHRTTVSDARGAFRFAQVRPDLRWSLEADHDSYVDMFIGPIDVPPHGGVQERITLVEGMTIEGGVFDFATGVPLAGARLVLEDLAGLANPDAATNPSRREVRSDESGHFRLARVRVTDRFLVCSLPGYGTSVQAHHELRRHETGGRRIEFDFHLERGVSITGQVRDPRGAGLAGARVEAIGALVIGVDADEEGRFVIPDLVNGEYSLQATVSGYFGDRVPARPGEEAILTLRPRGGLAGFVRDGEGRPTPEFEIIVRRSHPQDPAFGGSEASASFEGRTDGSFRIERLRPGNYVVQANAPGHAASFSAPVSVREGEITTDVLVRLAAGGTLAGRVVAKRDRQPLAGAAIGTNFTDWVDAEWLNFLGSLDPSALTIVQVTTDMEGRFEIPHMTPGDYQVRTRHPGFATEVINGVRLREGSRLDLGDLTLTEGASIRGTAFQGSGESGSGFLIHLLPTGSTSQHRSRKTRSDAEGRFLLDDVGPGTYSLSCLQPPPPGIPKLTTILDQRRSEIEIHVRPGEHYVHDLYLGR